MTLVQSMGELNGILGTDKDTLVVIQYTSENNAKFKDIGISFKEFESSYETAVFATVDVDDNEEIAAFNSVDKFPTFQFFKNKTKIDEICTVNMEELRELFKRHYTGDEIVEGDFVKVSSATPSPNPTKTRVTKVLNSEQWDMIISSSGSNTIFAYFTATWCGPCKKMSPIYTTIAEEKQGQTIFLKIDADECKEIFTKMDVKSLPTFLCLKNGKEVARVSGSKEQELKEMIRGEGDFVKASSTAPTPTPTKAGVTKVLNSKQWDMIISSSGANAVFAYFSATWCGPCKKISPVYIATAEEKHGQAIFLKIDADECKEIFTKMNVKNLPTFLCLKKGREVARVAGSKEEELKKMIIEEIKIVKVMSIAEECTSEEELRTLLRTNPNPISYDGFEPSGRMHLAQSILKSMHVNKLAKCGIKSIFWIADWHAMLNGKMGGQLKKIKKIGTYMIEVWKACGMDLDQVEFRWAADEINKNPNEYWMLVMNIARQNTMGRVKKCYPIMGKAVNDQKEKETGAHILYPCMQCADIFFLKADICQLGMDQQQVNILAREYAELPLVKEKYPVKPVILSHRLLPGLKEGKNKMSVSDPQSAIFVDDAAHEVKTKIKKSFCPPGIVKGNPCMEYLKYIVFAKLGSITIKRKSENGGDKTYTSYLELEADYRTAKLHPGDLKPALSAAINQILEPIRAHFKKGQLKQLLTQVKKLK